MNIHDKVISEKWVSCLTILVLVTALFFPWSFREIWGIAIAGSITAIVVKSENRKFAKENPNTKLSSPPNWMVVILWIIFAIQLLILGLASLTQQ